MLSYQGVMWPLCYRAFDQSRRSGGSSLFMLNISITFHIWNYFVVHLRAWEILKLSLAFQHSTRIHLKITQLQPVLEVLSFRVKVIDRAILSHGDLFRRQSEVQVLKRSRLWRWIYQTERTRGRTSQKTQPSRNLGVRSNIIDFYTQLSRILLH